MEKLYIKLLDNSYVWKIFKGNIYTCEEKDKQFAVLDKTRFNKYCKRLDQMNVNFKIKKEM